MQHYYQAKQVASRSHVVEFEGVIYDFARADLSSELFNLFRDRGYFETRPCKIDYRMFPSEIRSTHAEMYTQEDFRKNPNCVGTWVPMEYGSHTRVMNFCKPATLEGHPIYNNYQFMGTRKPHGIVYIDGFTIDLAEDRNIDFFIDLLILNKVIEIRRDMASNRHYYLHVINPRFERLNHVYIMNKHACAMNLAPFYMDKPIPEPLIIYKNGVSLPR